jgi:hypothetical protein
MSSDDDTPRARPRARSQWDDDRRAVVGREHRGGESGGVSTASERRRQLARAPVAPVPDMVERELGGPQEIAAANEVTSPIEILLDRELEPDDIEHVRRLRRDSDDPYAMLLKLAKRQVAKEQEERSNNQERATQLLAILNRPPDEATRRLVESRTKGAKWSIRLTWAAVVIIAGVAVDVADRIWNRSEHETALLYKVMAVEANALRDRADSKATTDRLEREIERLRDERDERSAAPRWAPQKDKP